MRVSSPVSSKRHSSTASAACENTEKLVPRPSNVAPSGKESPGDTASIMGAEPSGQVGRNRISGPDGVVAPTVERALGARPQQPTGPLSTRTGALTQHPP